MSFGQTFPMIALLLGKQNADLLDEHSADVSGKPLEAADSHFEACASVTGVP